MVTITRRMEFDAGHRVLGHEGRCKHLHGHRYACELVCSAAELDPLGRVVDFGVLKDLVGGWIDEHLDHNMILHPDDPLLAAGERPLAEDLVGRRPCVMPAEYPNPTAENIARLIHTEARRLLEPYPIDVALVRLYETPNCWAEYGRESGGGASPTAISRGR